MGSGQLMLTMMLSAMTSHKVVSRSYITASTRSHRLSPSPSDVLPESMKLSHIMYQLHTLWMVCRKNISKISPIKTLYDVCFFSLIPSGNQHAVICIVYITEQYSQKKYTRNATRVVYTPEGRPIVISLIWI